MKRLMLALLAAILVNLAIFFGLALLNKKQPKNRELAPVSQIRYTPLEFLAATPPAPEAVPEPEIAPPPEPTPQAASAQPARTPPSPIAESAAPELMDVQETLPPPPEAPPALPPLPLELPGLELAEMASPPSPMPLPPEPVEPPPDAIIRRPTPPPEPEPDPEPEVDVVFTPDGFIAVENITATLPTTPAYIEPPMQSVGPPPSRPSSGPTRAPQPLEFAEPIYPPAARQRGIEGQVTIRLHIGTDGLVSDIEVVHVLGHESFRDSVLRAVRRWRFTPALENGVPVTARGERTIIFDLD